MRLRIIESTDALRACASEWDQLWEHSEATAPSARAEIVALWVDTHGAGAPFRALVVEQEGQLLGALPLVGRRFLHLINTGMLPCNSWAASGDLLLDPGADTQGILNEMIQGLDSLPWKALVLEHVPFEEPRWQAFRAALSRAGRSVSVLEQHRVGQVEIGHDWSAYEATRKSRHRQRRRRYARILEKAGHTELKLHTELDAEGVHRELRRGFEVEDRSWKGREGTSALGSTGIFDYYLAEARQLARWGQLELVFLEHDGAPIAFCYGWKAKGVRYCVKVGFDDAFAKFGPGQQMMMRLLEHLHSDPRCRIYDFRGRLAPWTESWITDSYPVGRMVVTRRGSLNSVLRGAYARLQPAAKEARRRIREGRKSISRR